MAIAQRIEVIDSHTGGEPTRVVISGGPALGAGSMAERREIFRQHHDSFRRTVVNEPRGSDVLVGALLCTPLDPANAAGVIFFNNVGLLHMCGHGMIGLVVTLGHRGLIQAGRQTIETPVGPVRVEYDGAHRAAIENVPSYRYRKAVPVNVEGLGVVTGDIAWGGNWFFLVSEHGLVINHRNVDQLTDFAWRIRQALEQQGIAGEQGGRIDHIELFGPPLDPQNHSRNFVLCPGKAYDRSPCGTGTSAKLACLMAYGKLQPGQVWRQESILGSVFEASGQFAGERIIPRIVGNAYITSEATLIVHPADPFGEGFH